MSFADRVRKIITDGEERRTTDPDTQKDAASLAAEFVTLGSSKFVDSIGPPRASSLHDDCMRKRVLGVKLERMSTEWVGVKDRIVYGIGNALHTWIQNTPDILGDLRWGWWKCTGCWTVQFGMSPKRGCKKCGAFADAYVYREHEIKATPAWPVTGHPDMFVMRSKMLRILEAKSIAGDEFEKLVAPYARHEWQIMTYMWKCSEDKDLPVPVDGEIGYVLYITKKVGKTFPMKMFTVQKNTEILKQIKQKVTSYKKGIEYFPDKMPAVAFDCKNTDFNGAKAKFCPVLQDCLTYGGRG